MSLPGLASILGRAFGRDVRIVGTRALGAGAVGSAGCVSTSEGELFIKTSSGPRSSMFSSEARALETLRAASTSLVIPKPIAWRDPGDGPGYLVTELIQSDGSASRGDLEQSLGRGLAMLHKTSAPAFGFHVPTYCGTTEQPNPWTPNWTELYAQHRLGHLARALTAKGALDPKDSRRFAQLIERLPQLIESDEPPALIHGDLWSGNVLTTSSGCAALVDPSSSFSHREAELGMMTLFGGFSSRAYDSYSEVYPLEPGWKDRNPLYQLYHVANHALIFGGAYVQQTMTLVRRYL